MIEPNLTARQWVDMVALMRQAVVHESYGGGGSTPDPEATARLRKYAGAIAEVLAPEKSIAPSLIKPNIGDHGPAR